MDPPKKSINFVIAKITDTKCDALHDMIVIVPVKFLRMNQATNQILIAYLESQCPDDAKLVFDITRSNKLPPPSSWPLFEAVIIAACCMFYF